MTLSVKEPLKDQAQPLPAAWSPRRIETQVSSHIAIAALVQLTFVSFMAPR
jgi:hypothetical protein